MRELLECDTENEVRKCCWENDADGLAQQGLSQTFNLYQTQCLQSTIKQSAIKWSMPV